MGGVTKDYENKTSAHYRKDIGADAKIAVTSSLNLDLTVNPDFSQVEVDKQVTNLDRYELFFPEKRQFFLENNDLFANFGYDNIRPFFSRRIGLGVPINFGARLSGSLNKNWRIGVMDMQTKTVDSTGLPKQNFSVIALQRRIFKRSNIRFIFVNKESLNYNWSRDTSKPKYSLYNRNFGFEYNLAPSNNLWTGKVMLLKSFSPGNQQGEFAHAANIQHKSRKWTLSWEHEIIGNNYNAEVGYVPRKNYIRVNPKISRLFFPLSGPVLSHGPVIGVSDYFDKSFHPTDNESYVDYFFNMRDQSVFDILFAHDYVKLLQPFDPTNSGKDTLAAGTKHHANSVTATFFSKPQKLFTYDFSLRYGGYYADGKLLSMISDFGYRFQPFVSITLSTSYNHIELPQPWNTVDFWLFGPRIDVTFTNKLFFTTFLQYNSQLKNINLNTRLQWRYRPASDIFLVYTDNYYSAPLFVRNRAFVLKFTYWWNN